MKQKKKAFTLIELLVVVLIIGILSAIALPQYEKAVWKSRSTQLVVLVKNLANAQEAYFLENGTYATSFSPLVFDFDILSGREQGTASVSSDDATRNNDMVNLVVNVYTDLFVLSSVEFQIGPYKNCGFIFHHRSTNQQLKPKTLYCKEGIRAVAEGEFCRKVMGSRNLVSTQWGVRFFEFS